MKKRILSMVLCLCAAVGMLPVFAVRAQAADTKTMAQLREAFPPGKYWNHYVGSYGQDGDMMGTREDFADSVTGSPCNVHGATRGMVGIYDCNCFDGAWQCMGFARRLAYGYYGTRVSTWRADSDLSALKAGDVVQYNFSDSSYGHTVWVTAVNGGSITYADCNGESLISPSNNCKIRWDVSSAKSLFYSGTGNYRVYHAPSEAVESKSPPASAAPVDPARPTAETGDFYAHIYYPKGGNLVEAQGGDGVTFTNVQLSNENWNQAGFASSDPKQIWFFDRKDNGSYRIVNEWSGWCLDVCGDVAGPEINIGTWHEDHGKASERWYIKLAPGSDDKWYSLVTALEYPSYVMDVHNAGTAPGTNVQLYTTDWKTGNEAQQFNIIRLNEYGSDKPAKPSAPANVRVNAAGGEVTVSWDPVPPQNLYDAREYEVRIRNEETGVILSSEPRAGLSYTYSGVASGKWVAEVRAVNTKYSSHCANYCSDYSSQSFSIHPGFHITLGADPAEGGAISGGGLYQSGDTAFVTAAAHSGYRFVKWTEGGNFVTDNARWSFPVESDRTLTAVFERTPPDVSYPSWRNPYRDVPPHAWYYDAVRFASEDQIMTGDNGLFMPNAPLTRAMLAQILYNKAGMPYTAGGQVFVDAPRGMWYSNAITWASSNGIANGYGGYLFGPNDSVTREQLAVMLWRYAGAPASNMPVTAADAGQISGFAWDAMSWAVERGVLNGHSDGRLDPKGVTTRAQAAQVLKNLWGNR